jgi:hypothetical protein
MQYFETGPEGPELGGSQRELKSKAENTKAKKFLDIRMPRAPSPSQRSAQHPQIPRFLQIFRGIWPMHLSLLNHSAIALFVQRARSIGFCAIWVCISSSSSSPRGIGLEGPKRGTQRNLEKMRGLLRAVVSPSEN